MAPKTPRTGTRSSSRLAGQSTSPSSAQTSPANQNAAAESSSSATKRKAESSTSPSERSEKKAKPEQQTLEQTIGEGSNNQSIKDEQQQEPSENASKTETPSAKTADIGTATSADKEHATQVTEPSNTTEEPPKNATNGAVEESSDRKNALPSNVLEKGILYFFTRPRVGIDEPKSLQDIARSYIALRTLPDGAKLGEGPIDDSKKHRLLALPKKALPKSHSDRFMAFVEKQGPSIETLKEEFLASTTYETQTLGQRTSHPVTPIAEGVYAITTTGRESHLAYMLTIPSELGEVQNAMGLADKGSFIISTKNPESKGPANSQLDTPAEFSKDIMDDFRGRSWMPTEPKHLNFEKCQILLIGEAQGDLGKAVEAQEKDEKSPEKHTPQEELELLNNEDLQRVEGLKGDDSIFDDLRMSKNEYPKVPTTW